jgi:hypothetical protein
MNRPPPPPVFAPPPSNTAPSTSNFPPSSTPGGPPTDPSSFTSPTSASGGSGRRQRYVDTFNTNPAPVANSAPRRDPGAKQSLNFAGTIFTPAPLVPTEQPVAAPAEAENNEVAQQPPNM